MNLGPGLLCTCWGSIPSSCWSFRCAALLTPMAPPPSSSNSAGVCRGWLQQVLVKWPVWEQKSPRLGYTVKVVLSDTYVILFSVLSDMNFHSILTIFLCVLHYVIRHLCSLFICFVRHWFSCTFHNFQCVLHL